MARHLQDFSNATVWPAKVATVAADRIAISDSANGNNPAMVTLANLSGISAANIVNTPSGNLAATTIQAAVNELQADINSLTAVTGQYEGSAATLAALPAASATVGNGDWALLTAQDGGNAPGIYVMAGGVWTLGREIAPAAIANLTAATAGAAGTAGLAPGAAAGQQDFVLKGDATWAAPTSLVSNMVGATAGAPSTPGLVPVAAAGEQTFLLTGGGTFVNPSAYTSVDMVGATGVANGTAGQVPQPLIANQLQFLRGDGTWASVATGASSLQATTDIGTVTTNDIEHTVATVGTILRAPDAGRWRVTVDNAGSLITTVVV